MESTEHLIYVVSNRGTECATSSTESYHKCPSCEKEDALYLLDAWEEDKDTEMETLACQECDTFVLGVYTDNPELKLEKPVITSWIY